MIITIHLSDNFNEPLIIFMNVINLVIEFPHLNQSAFKNEAKMLLEHIITVLDKFEIFIYRDFELIGNENKLLI